MGKRTLRQIVARGFHIQSQVSEWTSYVLSNQQHHSHPYPRASSLPFSPLFKLGKLSLTWTSCQNKTQKPMSPTSGVPGPWWGSKDTRLRCRVVMPAPSAIWVGCMLARRRVSWGSPVFISSSVMVARLREGCMGWKCLELEQDSPRLSSQTQHVEQLEPSYCKRTPALLLSLPTPCTKARAELSQADLSKLLPTHSTSPLNSLPAGCSTGSIPSPSWRPETQGTSTQARSVGGTGM